jgi:hypothetical protein
MKREEIYLRGERAAWRRILSTALFELGYDLKSLKAARLITERESAIAMLRQVCDEHGDNNWDEKLHLADVVEKHLWRHLREEK